LALLALIASKLRKVIYFFLLQIVTVMRNRETFKFDASVIKQQTRHARDLLAPVWGWFTEGSTLPN